MRLQYQTDHGRRYVKMAYVFGAFLLGAVPAAMIRSPGEDVRVHVLGWILLVASQMLALAIRSRVLRDTGLWVSSGHPMHAGFRAPIKGSDGLAGLEVERTSWGHREMTIKASTWSTVGLRRSVGPMAEIIDGDNPNRLLVRVWTDDKPSPWGPTGVTWGEHDDEKIAAALAADVRQRTGRADTPNASEVASSLMDER